MSADIAATCPPLAASITALRPSVGLRASTGTPPCISSRTMAASPAAAAAHSLRTGSPRHHSPWAGNCDSAAAAAQWRRRRAAPTAAADSQPAPTSRARVVSASASRAMADARAAAEAVRRARSTPRQAWQDPKTRRRLAAPAGERRERARARSWAGR
eukprot:scaffold1496_cov110-Isochrysis_galbana.AAC.4